MQRGQLNQSEFIDKRKIVSFTLKAEREMRTIRVVLYIDISGMQ